MIEKNIPMPAPRAASASMGDTYRKMEVGDSVMLPTSDNRHRNMATAAAVATKGAAKFMQRQCEGGMRIWRTA